MATHRLKKKDAQLLEVGGNRQTGMPGYDWPPFLNGTPGVHDYIECNVYDEQGKTLIETFITKDYEVENNQVILKPGNDLRSLGYVRGKYQVKYNFLREEFGTDETILVYADNNEVYTGPKRLYPARADRPWYIDDDNLIYSGVKGEEVESRRELLIKNNSAWIHKISDDRKELRIVPNNIESDKYKESFDTLRQTIKRWVTTTSMPDGKRVRPEMTLSEGFGGTLIRLAGSPAEFPRSHQMTPKMVGGEFIFDRGFITNIERRVIMTPRMQDPRYMAAGIQDEIPRPNEPLLPYEAQKRPILNKTLPIYKPSANMVSNFKFLTTMAGI